VRDAGPPASPPSGTPTIAPSELEVTSVVSPDAPSSLIDGGLATFTISVHNPFTHGVIVSLPPGTGSVPVSYGYAMRESAGGGVTSGDFAFDSGITYFAAGETKRDVIDFFVIPPDFPSYVGPPGLGASGIALPPGTTDEQYVIGLLRATGVLCVYGSGFGMPPGDGFLRIVFLASPEELNAIYDLMAGFTRDYLSGGGR